MADYALLASLKLKWEEPWESRAACVVLQRSTASLNEQMWWGNLAGHTWCRTCTPYLTVEGKCSADILCSVVAFGSVGRCLRARSACVRVYYVCGNAPLFRRPCHHNERGNVHDQQDAAGPIRRDRSPSLLSPGNRATPLHMFYEASICMVQDCLSRRVQC